MKDVHALLVTLYSDTASNVAARVCTELQLKQDVQQPHVH